MEDNFIVLYFYWLVNFLKVNILFLFEIKCFVLDVFFKIIFFNFVFVDGVDFVGYSGGFLLCWGKDICGYFG